MQAINRFTITLLCLLLFTHANAATLDSKLDGVWQGTMSSKQSGNKKIMTILSYDSKSGVTNGNYYTLPDGNEMALNGSVNLAELIGGDSSHPATKTAFEWQFTSVAKQSISANRINTDTKAVELIHLIPAKQVRGKAPQYSIYNDISNGFTYDQPRAKAYLNHAKINNLHFEEKSFQTLSITPTTSKISTIQLTSDTQNSAIAAINRKLYHNLNDSIYDAIGCSVMYGDIEQSTKITFWSNNWLSLQTNSFSYCGGVHPNFSVDHQIYNLSTGKNENLQSWFKNKSTRSKLNLAICKEELTNPCKSLISEEHFDFASETCNAYRKEKKHANQKEITKSCLEDITLGVPYGFGYGLGLSSKGMIFRTSADGASGSGNYSILMPYQKILPFLNQTGKAHVQAIINAQPQN